MALNLWATESAFYFYGPQANYNNKIKRLNKIIILRTRILWRETHYRSAHKTAQLYFYFHGSLGSTAVKGRLGRNDAKNVRSHWHNTIISYCTLAVTYYNKDARVVHRLHFHVFLNTGPLDVFGAGFTAEVTYCESAQLASFAVSPPQPTPLATRTLQRCT